MTTSLPCLCSLTRPSYKPKLQKCLQVRSQSFNDEGNAENVVDGNMRALRERIRDVRKKERLDMCWRVENENGWKYKDEYNNKHKRLKSQYGMLSESIMLLGLVSSAFGLAFFTGSICIFLVSFIVHLCNKGS
ncbi:uncharacterized protein LOC114317116 [Camellia sinensis]|uniref:uncharacterized protein LOC114317116 n=1 Tax=Camellia sinensis TaxID=4442 RepID=UPI0010368526|nr:uncharacterized protein LOC114317116 [Camellia sinensis]